jgi:hypothetical protein
MRICILCEDSKVELARQNSKAISNNKVKSDIPKGVAAFKERLGIANIEFQHLSIPVSETGQLPATHWFCFMNVDEEGYQKLLAVQEHSVYEESAPKEFLERWNLKVIR